ncbi:glycoside hydrolase family 5 protein [Treponema zioleckii]|uniref:glycoside hydrolase family 5 protein n=1 Tax=Treponema zioleckii TaxID=331680 RepID=UPI00168A66B4|nr:glycoside hydrolase family 5 protein [Treponema zioleckii]
MKKTLFWGRLAAAFMLLAITAFTAYAAGGAKYAFNSKKALKDKGSAKFNESVTALALVNDMKTGWNLGNTLDANAKSGLESETSWGQPLATKKQIDALSAAGFKTIRLPVSWKNHIIDDKYTIDPAWMARVKQVVDWAISDGMYVILNDHHDNFENEGAMSYGDGYYPSSLNYNESLRFVRNLWAQISLAFNKGYDEHLIFEVLNEPRLRGHAHEWNYNPSCTACKDAVSNLNKLNQLALDTIRASGKNNKNRFVMVTGLAASMNSFTSQSSWKLPNDSAEGRLLLSVHLYVPYPFAMQNPGVSEFTENLTAELSYDFEWLNEHFVKKGVPVVIGEYGATNKNNTEDRVKWFKFFVSESRKYGMVACLWDNGDWNARNTFEEKFGFFNREEGTFYFPEIIEAIMETLQVDFANKN